jgi:iron-sulfur cluster assembly protein
VLQVSRSSRRSTLGYTLVMATVEQQETTLVTLTERAASKVSGIMAEEPAGEAEVLRIAIQGGGCSGFEYALGFDRGAQEGDHAFECEGVTVVVDPFSAPYLLGAQVDYLETIQESGFKIENPNATASCGCGHSFQVAEGEAPEDAAGCGSGCSH